MGAGIQWQGPVRYGNLGGQTILDPSNPIPTAIDDPSVDAFDLYFVKGSYLTTGTLGYNFRLRNGNPLALNLVVNNLLNQQGGVFGDASINQASQLRQPEGNLSLPNRIPTGSFWSRIRDPISFKLTATYTFGGAGAR